MAIVYLGIGSNQDAARHLQLAVHELDKRFGLEAVSPVYRNRPVGFRGDDFLNAVARIRTTALPHEVFRQLEEIHELAGRERSDQKFAPRRLDIDLLLYDDLTIDDPPVVVPRPDILAYSFVLKPLADIAPDLRHPGTGRNMAAHWHAFDADSHPLTEIVGIL